MKIFHTPEVFTIKLNIDGNGIGYDHPGCAVPPGHRPHPSCRFPRTGPTKPISIAIPVHVSGTSTGVLKGGKLIRKVRQVNCQGLAKDLPDNVPIDITALEIGDSVKISDLKPTGNYVFLDPPTNVIVGVRTARAVVEETGPGAARR